jgi:hypothetical protein
MTEPVATAEIARGRRTLIGLAALFFVPLAIAFALYYAGGWRPAGQTNHGELITPPIPLESVAFTLPDGTTSARVDLMRDKWTLVYVGNGTCVAEECQHALWVMRQTRQLLAQDMDRVARLFIAKQDCCNMALFDKEHAGMEVVQVDDPTARDAVQRFPDQDQLRMLYVVDPLGNLMMRFDTREDPKGLLRDLEKLLKLSHIG